MTIPQQVEDAAKEAEDFIASLSGDTGTEGQETTKDVASEETAEETTKEPVENNDTSEEEDTAIYEQRYKTLKGKYDAEIPRLQDELKELKASIFEKLEAKDDDPKTEEQDVAPEVNDKLEKFREEYGDDFVDGLKDIILSEVQPLVSEKVKPVEERVQVLDDAKATEEKSSFETSLDDNVKGDWRKAWSGDDPKFIEFLQKDDPSGLYNYGDLLNQCNENWDSTKMSKIFNIYFGDGKKEQKQEQGSNPVKDAALAPERKTNSSVPDAGEKKVWTQDAIKEFETNDRRNKYSAEESKALWDDLLSAVSENRIRN